MVWVSPTEDAKNVLFLAYLVIALVFNMGYMAHLILEGKLAEWACRSEALDMWNDGISEIIENETNLDLDSNLTRNECKKLLWVDFGGKLIFTIYFTYVIMRWSRYSDYYHKA